MYGYIYITTNLINNNVYIGQHKSSEYDPNYLGSGTILTRAIKKYGKENFSNEILYEANSQQELNEKEIYYIAKYKKMYKEKCYNVAKGGNAGNILLYMSEDERKAFIKKMTKINQERCSTDEFKQKISAANKKRYSHESERIKQSEKIKESWSDEKLKQEQSQRLKQYYSTHKKDSSYQNKKCVFELNDQYIEFESVKDLRNFLIEKYNYNPDRRTFKKLMENGSKRIPFVPFHKNKLSELEGMIIYYK